MTKILYLLLISLPILISCKESGEESADLVNNKQWKFVREIKIDNISPTGLQTDGEYLWISDAKNNRVIKTDLDGSIVKEYPDIKRPMHLSIYNSKVYVPEYLTDKIKIINGDEIEEYPLKEKPDAPAGVFVNDSLIAVVDFYNHRIILQNENEVMIIGKEGHKKGELYYPTDVALVNDKIYVADAYNNRVQVFDYNGNVLKVIGAKDKINVATGIEVTDDNIFVTDFEGDRILIYDLYGKLIHIINEHLNKPTEISVSNNTMYVSNYAGSSISVIEQ
ncbi:MAG: NHL repeat-containing protein [Bacteroidetes bacterium]|nr:NHL repeat-containing protein [Bacteroidota bacterium]